MVTISSDELRLSGELTEYLGDPGLVVVYGAGEQTWLRTMNFALWPKILKRIAFDRRVLIARRGKRISGTEMGYRILFNKGSDGLTHNYRTINYGSRILLFSSQSDNVALDREQFWKNIAGYHEHLDVDLQKEDVKTRTQWLASEINAYQPDSVLELGCGGGRNLYFIQQANPDCNLYGVEINPAAVQVAQNLLGPNFKLLSSSIYDLEAIETDSVDVVFTSGVLMHISGDKLPEITANIKRIARKAIIHYELHGPSHTFDFHRYPRDYGKLYPDFREEARYEVFDRQDFRNAGTESFHHCLLKIPL
ncbi:methyltransferase domain-containing protein [Lewinella sp. IMCC34191]|uniref:methyltransferase domain-containing protein n=1 Tax=Lewinella sp. IMCC34191 TaxID=2259172 RepID=UPI000E27E1CA|nr:methyltransferase domain-containing protein [Lewinella sp. IMCC34191]